MGRVIGALAFAAFWLGTAGADEVLLKNGHVFQGKIIFIDQDKVTIRIQLGGQDSYVDMTFDRTKVQDIKYEAAVFKAPAPAEAEPEVKEEKAEEPAAQPKAEGAGEEKGKEGEAPAAGGAAPGEEIDPALKAQIASLIKALDTPDVQAKGEAESKLVALGRSAVPFLAAALKNPSTEQRYSCIWVLQKLGDKRAVQALIAVLKAEATTEDQRRCQSAANDALRAITGQNFPFSEAAPAAERAQQAPGWLRMAEREAEFQRALMAQLAACPALPTRPIEPPSVQAVF
ncbi:MAG: hypothetical protein N3A66_11075, partial [Planctomycetota bacterium]|nr:hypothetical protein [Planctomycetota bacterium]